MIKTKTMQPRQITIQAKEIIFKDSEKDAFFDAFIYEPEKSNFSKGHLLIVGQINTPDDSLSYAPNLIASFIKREYYESQEENNKTNFENSLKKTNELISDLAANKKAPVDMSCVLVYGQNIHVSKVGKAKLLLSRDNNCIDIFKNVDLFNKTLHSPGLRIANKEFSNIISGKLNPNDKLLLFIPTRRLSAKEKSIKNNLISFNHEEFKTSLIDIKKPPKSGEATSGQALNCCAIWFEIKENERPDAEHPSAEVELAMPAPDVKTDSRDNVPDVLLNEKVPILLRRIEDPRQVGTMSAVGREISRNTKESLFRKSYYFIKKVNEMNLLNNKKAFFTLLGVVIVVVGTGFFIFKQQKENVNINRNLKQVQESLNLAESKSLSGENKEARKIIEEAIAAVKGQNIKGEKKNAALASAYNILNKIDKTNSNKPVLIAEIEAGFSLSSIVGTNGIFFADGSVVKTFKDSVVNEVIDFSEINEGGNKIIGLRYYKDNLAGVTESGNILIYNFEKKKTRNIKSGYQPVRDFGIYEGNIYLLLPSSLLKVPDFLESEIKFQPWFKNPQEKNFYTLNTDQSIHFLADGDKLLRYFKGELIEENPLEFVLSENSKIFDLVSSFLIFDGGNRKARLIDRNGKLLTTYYLDNIDTAIDASYNSETSTLYILSPTKLWSLKIEK